MKIKNKIKKNLLNFATILFIGSYAILFMDLYFSKGENDFLEGNVLAPSSYQLNKEAESFSFSAFGDTGARTSIIDLIAAEVLESDDKFLLQLGDLFRYCSLAHVRWITDELINEIGDFPIYSTPGNHDIDKKHGRLYYQSVFGQPNYFFSYGNSLFISFDSASLSFTDENLSWLKNVLEKYRKDFKYCIIYTHVPPVDHRKNSNYSLPKIEAQKLYDVISDYQINLIISGHIHAYGTTNFHNIPLVVLPASGQKNRGENWGYVRFHINKDGITHELISFKNPSEYREYIEAYFSNYHSMNFYMTSFSLMLFFMAILSTILWRNHVKKQHKSSKNR